MKKILCAILTASAVFLFGCSAGDSGPSSAPSPKAELTIAAAASLTDVTKEIADGYQTKNPNIPLTFTYASSGALQTQIEQGSPVDVFMSAAAKQMDALEQKDLIDKNTRTDMLENKVVLITPKDSKLGIRSFGDLAEESVKKIAIGDPASVPAGQYAQKVFTSLKIWEPVQAKSNYATDVRQVLTWVEFGNVDCGVVYKTDAATSKDITVICEASEGSSDRIIYPAAVVKSSRHPAEAQDFIRYMQTAPVLDLFKKYGFDTVK